MSIIQVLLLLVTVHARREKIESDGGLTRVRVGCQEVAQWMMHLGGQYWSHEKEAHKPLNRVIQAHVLLMAYNDMNCPYSKRVKGRTVVCSLFFCYLTSSYFTYM